MQTVLVVSKFQCKTQVKLKVHTNPYLLRYSYTWKGESVCGGEEGGKDRKAPPHQTPGYISLTTSMGLGQERGVNRPLH